MSTSESANIQYPHPEGLSRHEAMRHETGPVLTLASMYVLRAAQDILEQLPQGSAEGTTVEIIEAAHEQVVQALEDSTMVTEENWLSLAGIHNIRYHHSGVSQYGPLFYTFKNRRDYAFSHHILDGFYPQLKLTNNLLVPAYLRTKYDTDSTEPYSPELLASILEEPAFQDILIHTSKTGNGLWRDGYGYLKGQFRLSDILDKSAEPGSALERFFEDMQALYQETYAVAGPPPHVSSFRDLQIDPTNLCVVNENGTITISPYARKYLHAYLRYCNDADEEAVQEEKHHTLEDHINNTAGCPVSLRSGNFPFKFITTEALQAHFNAATQEDGTIQVPGIMTITPDGKYHYTGTSPAILALNQLYANHIRHIAS